MIRLEPGVVASIVLDRPDQRNALTPQMLRSIPKILAAAQREGARAILVQGAGRVFCSGFDLKQCVSEPSLIGELLESLSNAIKAIRDCQLPVVLACHGAAIAGACALLGGADIVVADRHAKLGYPVVRLGISPAISAPYLTQDVTQGAARRLLLDPNLITGEDGFALGLVHELVAERVEVQQRAREIARALATKPPRAVSTTKSWLTRLGGPSEEFAARGLEASMSLVGSAEQQARLAALWGDPPKH